MFQDLIKRTIGSGREENGLYLLELQDRHQLANHSTLIDSMTGDIMLWHRRLGHPSFGLLKYLFPSLVFNKTVSTFRCEDCELGKHQCASCYPNNNKSTVPFSLIHSNVWGASHVISFKGHRW